MSISNQENQLGVRQVLIGAENISAATANFDFVLPKEFDRVVCKLVNLSPTADAALQMLLKLQGATDFATAGASYAWSDNAVVAGAVAATVTGSASATEMVLATQVGADTNEGACGDIIIDDFYSQSAAGGLPRALTSIRADLNVVNGTPAYVQHKMAGHYILAASNMVEARLVFPATTMAAGRVEVYGEYIGD